MLLQWPHQGAKNLINTLLPAVASSQESGVSSVAEATASEAATRMADRSILLCFVKLC